MIPAGRVREKPKISEINCFGANIKKGDNTIMPVNINPTLKDLRFFHSFLINK